MGMWTARRNAGFGLEWEVTVCTHFLIQCNTDTKEV